KYFMRISGRGIFLDECYLICLGPLRYFLFPVGHAKTIYSGQGIANNKLTTYPQGYPQNN
ncbi:MAG: hypothetical protein MJB12_12735, partial [Firmicutes bacterium]|nr:hypothetical protein [Bacillota bacterium]